MKLQLEINSNFKSDKDTDALATKGILITPPVGENYWLFRVKVSKKQAIVGFPKFGTVGIGFAKETDWNTNLPYQCTTDEIYNHIKHNLGKGNFSNSIHTRIKQAIAMVQDAAKTV